MKYERWEDINIGASGAPAEIVPRAMFNMIGDDDPQFAGRKHYVPHSFDNLIRTYPNITAPNIKGQLRLALLDAPDSIVSEGQREQLQEILALDAIK